MLPGQGKPAHIFLFQSDYTYEERDIMTDKNTPVTFTLTEQQILDAANACSSARQTLQILFPDVFARVIDDWTLTCHKENNQCYLYLQRKELLERLQRSNDPFVMFDLSNGNLRTGTVRTLTYLDDGETKMGILGEDVKITPKGIIVEDNVYDNTHDDDESEDGD